MTTLYKTEGIMLGHYDIGEADKAISVFTKDFGKISVACKGVRLQKSKLRGHLSTGSHIRIAFVGGSEFFRLTDAEENNNFFASFSEEKKALAGRSMSLVSRMIQGSEKDEGIWNLLLGFLEHLRRVKNGINYEMYGKVFAARLLYRLGYVDDPEDAVLADIILSEGWDGLNVKDEHLNTIEDVLDRGILSSHL